MNVTKSLADNPKPPNIVFIYPDQFRGDNLGFMGHPVAKTPSLDAIAVEGVTFSQCFTPAPLCRPARTSLFTGLYPSEHRVWGHDDAVENPKCMPSHVRDIRKAGYCTALIGKTHLHRGDGHLDHHKQILVDWGFDQDHIVELTGPYEMAEIKSAYSDFLAEEKYERFQCYTRRVRQKHHVCTQWATPAPDQDPWDLNTDDHADTYTGQRAAKWIRNYADSSDTRPFYLQVCFPGPHNPFDAPSEWRGRYSPDDPNMPLPPTLEPPKPSSRLIDDVRGYAQCQDDNEEPCTAVQVRQLQQLYYAKVELIDAAIGQVMTALRETGQDENTWIVFTSDHGEMLGDHGMIGKIAFLEKSIHIPLIIRPPQTLSSDRDWQCTALVDQLDVTVSLLAMAGITSSAIHGQSLLSKIDNGPEAPDANQGKDYVLSQVGPLPESPRYQMIRTQTHKLVFEDTQPIEFYDLVNDPAETENRIQELTLQDKCDALTAILQEIVTPD